MDFSLPWINCFLGLIHKTLSHQSMTLFYSHFWVFRILRVSFNENYFEYLLIVFLIIFYSCMKMSNFDFLLWPCLCQNYKLVSICIELRSCEWGFGNFSSFFSILSYYQHAKSLIQTIFVLKKNWSQISKVNFKN